MAADTASIPGVKEFFLNFGLYITNRRITKITVGIPRYHIEKNSGAEFLHLIAKQQIARIPSRAGSRSSLIMRVEETIIARI